MSTLPITSGKKERPPIILIYGPGGIGKTTFAASWKGSVILPIEDGCSEVDCQALPLQPDWQTTMETIDRLIEDTQGIKVLVVDSLSALQEKLFMDVCLEYQVKSIEKADGGYGKGYVRASEKWREFLERLTILRSKGVTILLIAHAAVTKCQDPRLPEFERLTSRVYVSATGAGILPQTVEFCDAVFCVAPDIFVADADKKRAGGEGNRILYTQDRPAFIAKNRFGLPAELPFGADFPQGGDIIDHYRRTTWAPIVGQIRATYKKPTAIDTAPKTVETTIQSPADIIGQ
jgi:adenylate kinase family enzyme